MEHSDGQPEKREADGGAQAKTGYWLADRAGTGAAAQPLAAGLRVKNADDAPPWMVVAETIQSIIPAAGSWPGRLWRARVIKLGDMSGLIANPGYWRASEIELIEELPAGMLFGPNGDSIIPLLNQITALTSREVDCLSANSVETSGAQTAYARAWDRWDENLAHPCGHDYGAPGGWTLAAPDPRNEEMSPANWGFSLISDLIWNRAREVDGDKAFVEYIEDDQVEVELNRRWRDASGAFLFKAMELVMAQHLSQDERAELARPWESTFGSGQGAAP